jgi:NifU-like protein involved in Fe-S cluster formation
VATHVTRPSRSNFGVSADPSSSAAGAPGGANDFVSVMTTLPSLHGSVGALSPHPASTYIFTDGSTYSLASVHAAAMINDVYNRRIIELAGNIPRIGRLADPDATAKAVSKLCGSTVTIDLKMDGDTVTDFAHEVKACALGQASSSIMARNVIGSNASELRALRENVRKMLKENGAPPADGKWADIAVLEPVRDYKARHASTMLTFDAVVDAIDQIEARAGTKAAAE